MSLSILFWIGDLLLKSETMFIFMSTTAGTAAICYAIAGAISDEAWGKDGSPANRLAFKSLVLCFIFAALASATPSGRTIMIAQAEYIAQMPMPKKMIARAANWLDASFLPGMEK